MDTSFRSELFHGKSFPGSVDKQGGGHRFCARLLPFPQKCGRSPFLWGDSPGHQGRSFCWLNLINDCWEIT
jgi:hypothetical protein